MNSDQIAQKDRAKDALSFYKKEIFFALSISKKSAALTTFCMPYVVLFTSYRLTSLIRRCAVLSFSLV
jgi:hypothetical protein